MAVYVYPHEHYRFWEAELGRPDLPSGQFGENLTITGVSEDSTRVGDGGVALIVASLTLAVIAARIK
jgi:MOSC domain-containing protein YiiM